MLTQFSFSGQIGAFVLDWHQQETTGVEARPLLENVHRCALRASAPNIIVQICVHMFFLIKQQI